MLVYKITNTINGKAYIGVTKQSLAARWKCHRAYSKREAAFPIHAAIRKYGVENFTITVICECSSLEELAVCERGLIAEHGTYTPHGYNVTSGGEGCFERVISDATRAKRSAWLKAAIADGRFKVPSRKGQPVSQETRRKMSLAKLGWNPTPEMVERMHARNSGDGNIMRRSRAAVEASAEKRRGAKRSLETRLKMSAKRNPLLKPEQVIAIKRLADAGKAFHALIGMNFGISANMVANIKMMRIYKTVFEQNIQVKGK